MASIPELLDGPVTLEVECLDRRYLNGYIGPLPTSDLPSTPHPPLFRPPYGWKVARLFARLEARVFRPAVAIFTGNDAVLMFPLRASLDRVDAQLDELIYQAFPQIKAA